MYKGKEWLKETLKNRMDYWVLNLAGGDYGRGRSDETRELLKAIDQLDEPEITEEQAWKTIAKSTNRPVMFWENMRDNYLSSLKEPELPAIPRFVADYLDDFKKQNLTLGDALDTHFEDDKQIHTWLYEDGEVRNDEVFARAWLDGYTVEKQSQYYVRENNYLLCKYNNEVLDYVEAVEREITDLVELKLTEKEIKDYDERYWAFAEEADQ